MKRSTIIRLTAVSGALSVGLGAFAAHGLEKLVSPQYLETFTTGVRYQFYHTLAIGLAACLDRFPGMRSRRIRLAVWLWSAGILLFSGSLYLLSIREVIPGLPVAVLGPITPLGGLLLIGGWLILFLSVTDRVNDQI